MKKLLFALLLVCITWMIAYTLLDNPHNFPESRCGKCHVDTVGSPRKLTASVTSLCLPCHRKTTRRSSHPVDMAPRIVRIPADLPLMNGMVTCITCHNIHADRFDGFGKKTYFLRRSPSGRDFCIACHETNTAKNSHIEMVAFSHMKGKYTVTGKSRPLDPMSMDCIGCHDGILGKSTSYTLGKGVWSHDNGAHPIGVNYRDSRMKKGNLKPVELLDKSIRLYNGNIGCGTCHDVYSKIPSQLVMSNDGSRLCLSCHDK